MPKIRTWLTRSCIASAVAALGAIGIAQPASAVQTDIQICNSSASVNFIRAYKTDNSWSDSIEPGLCTAWVNNTGSNPVRVQIYSGTGSYKLGKIGEGYGPCHGGSNSASDPPNDAPNGVRYRTYWNSYCG